MLFDPLQMTSTLTTLTVSPSHMGYLVDIFGHMPLDFLMMTIMVMATTTVPVPSTLVTLLLPLLGSTIFVSLESQVDGRTTGE